MIDYSGVGGPKKDSKNMNDAKYGTNDSDDDKISHAVKIQVRRNINVKKYEEMYVKLNYKNEYIKWCNV